MGDQPVQQFTQADRDFFPNLLESGAAGGWYISFRAFADCAQTLPSGFALNEFPAETAAERMELPWHTVSPQIPDFRHQKNVLVRDTVPVYTYDAMAARIPAERGRTRLTEQELLEFLLTEQFTQKGISKALYASPHFLLGGDGAFTVTP